MSRLFIIIYWANGEIRTKSYILKNEDFDIFDRIFRKESATCNLKQRDTTDCVVGSAYCCLNSERNWDYYKIQIYRA